MEPTSIPPTEFHVCHVRSCVKYSNNATEIRLLQSVLHSAARLSLRVAIQSKIDCSKVKKWSPRGNSWVPSAARYCEKCGKYQLEMCTKWSSTEWRWIKGLYKDIYKIYGSHKFTRHFGRSAWFDFEVSRDHVSGGFACPKHTMVKRSDVARRVFQKDQDLIQLLQDIDTKPTAIYLVSFMLQLQLFSHWELFGVTEEGSLGDDLVRRRQKELKTMYKVF